MSTKEGKQSFVTRLESADGVGGTWIDFQVHLMQSMNTSDRSLELTDTKKSKVHSFLNKYGPHGTKEAKKNNYMNRNVSQHSAERQQTANAFYYNLFLKKYRPFLKQSFHTIGSIRYPHSDSVSCPLTKRNHVWQYEFNKERRLNTRINSNDSWLNLLYKREGYVETMQKAHEHIESCLDQLVEYYKMKVSVDSTRLNTNTNEKQKALDIDLAWELYNICERSKLYEHPMFRVCAGFKVLNSPNPQSSKFMDRFRYMVHNRPQKTSRSEPAEDEKNNFRNLSNVEYILTQNDVKYFFMSSDLYDSPKYMIKKVEHHSDDSTPFKKANNTKNNKGVIVPQLDCSSLSSNGMKLLEKDKSAKSGNLFLAWPTLHDASAYYRY